MTEFFFNSENLESDWLQWELLFESYSILKKNVASYNITLPAENYILDINGELLKLKMHNTTSVNMEQIVVGNHGLELESKNNFAVINIKGDKAAKLNGEITFYEGDGELYIFSKEGFEIDGLKLTNIILYLISASVESYFTQNVEDINREAIQGVIFNHDLKSFTIIGNGVLGDNSSLIIYSSNGICNAVINVSNITFEFYKDNEISPYIPYIDSNCQILSNNFTLNSLNATTLLSLNSNLVSQEINIKSGGMIRLNSEFKTNGSGKITIEANQFEVISNWLVATQELNLISSDANDLVTTGKLQSSGNMLLKAKNIILHNEVIDCLGLIELKVSEAIYLYINSGIKAQALIIESYDGKRIGLLHLESARIDIGGDASINANIIEVGISGLVPKQLSTKIPNGCYSMTLDVLSPNKALIGTGIYIAGNLFLDVNQVVINLANIQASKNIVLINSATPTVSLISEAVNKEVALYNFKANGMGSLGRRLLHGMCTNYVEKCLIPNFGGTPYIDSVGEWHICKTVQETFCFPASFSALEGIYGNFARMEVGCFKDSVATYIDAAAKIQQLLGGVPVNSYALAQVAKGITTARYKELYITPPKPVKATEQESRPAQSLDKINFEGNFHLKKNVAQITDSKQELDNAYAYLYKQRYPALSSCGIDITKILTALNLSPQDVGTILCDSDCQLDLVKKSLEQVIGFSDLSFILPTLKPYFDQHFKDANMKEKDCASINLLLNNGLEQYKRLGAVVGWPIEQSKFYLITSPFIWPVYETYGGIKVLAPAVYFPHQLIADAPARVGVFIYGKYIDINVNEALIGGTLFLGGGKVVGKDMAVVGTINKFGQEPLTIEVDNLAVATMTKLKQINAQDIRTEVMPQAGIVAQEGEVVILVHNDFLIKAGNLEGKISAQVGGDVIIVPAIDVSTHEHYHKKGYHKWISVKNIPSTFKGDITFISDGNQHILGAKVEGNSNVQFSSTKGYINAQPSKDIYSEESKWKSSKWYGSSKTSTTFHHKEEISGNVFGSNGLPLESLTLTAYGNVALYAMEAYTNRLFMQAGENNPEPQTLTISSAQIHESYYSQEDKRSLGFSFTSSGISFMNIKETSVIDTTVTQVPSKIVVFSNVNGYPAYLISNGQYTQLASQIDCDGKLIISAPNGIFISDLPNYKVHLVEVEEGKAGLYFNINKEEVGLKLGVEIKSFQKQTIFELPAVSGISAENIEMYFENGNLHTRGAIFTYQQAIFKGLAHIDEPAAARFFEETKETKGSINLKLGFRSNLCNAIDNTKEASAQKINSIESGINTYFQYRGAFIEWLKFLNLPVQFGLYIHAKFEQSKFVIEKVVPSTSEFTGAETIHEVVEKLKMIGTKIHGLKWYVSAREILLTSAFSSFEQKSSAQSLELIMPIGSAIIPTLNIMPFNDKRGTVRDYHQLEIMLEDELVFDIAGVINIEGAYIEADNIIINAKQLFIKSVQKLAQQSGISFSISSSDVTKIDNAFSGVGGHVERRDMRWVHEITAILGRVNVELILGESLDIIGSIIASAARNADGSLTDKGKLHIKATEIFTESLYGYDDGILLGASIAKAESKHIFGDSYSAEFSYSDLEQVVKAGLGEGVIEGEIKGDHTRDINDVKSESGIKIDPIKVKYQSVDWSKLGENLFNGQYGERVYEESGLKGAYQALKDFFTREEPLKPQEYFGGEEEEFIDLDEEAVKEEKASNKKETKKSTPESCSVGSNCAGGPSEEYGPPMPEGLKEKSAFLEYAKQKMYKEGYSAEEQEKMILILRHFADADYATQQRMQKHIEGILEGKPEFQNAMAGADGDILSGAEYINVFAPVAIPAGKGLVEIASLMAAFIAYNVMKTAKETGRSHSYEGFKFSDGKHYEKSKDDIAKDKKGNYADGGASAGAGAPDPDDPRNNEKWKEWKKNDQGKWEHSNSKDFEGIPNRPNTQDETLQNIYNELWRPNNEIPGGTAQMLREEVREGQIKPEHLQKAEERLTQLIKRIEKANIGQQPLSRLERETADRVATDLKEAIKMFKNSQNK